MKISDREILERAVNPFTTQDFVKVREVTVTNRMINVGDISDGVITNKPSELKSKLLLEDESFCKVYTRMGYRLHILELSDNAKSLFLWIIYEMNANCDYIEITGRQRKRYIAEAKKSNIAINMAIKELINASVISATTINGVYWINPLFIFTGNRISKYPDKLLQR